MDAERWKRIEGLLHQAMERPPAERDAFLKRACAGDEDLEREVRSLASAGQAASSFLERPAVEQAAREMAREDLSGQTVSHYKILEMLGAGGMGMVYKAYDTRLDRPVALKFLPPGLRHNPELKQRLSEEARAASTLDHPNIVVIYDIDETNRGDLFIAMAYHEGVTLRDKIAEAKANGLPVAEALEIARQVATGLAKAHERGVFHRDIKPGNIIVAKDGVTRIIDFGLAKSTDATATLDGSTKGTPLYMSPEQASGKPLDCRTDLWSLGVVLYEMLAGSPPFTGDSHLSIMHAIVHDGPPRLAGIRPDLPPEAGRIVARALEKDPAARYSSAAEMVRDLSAALSALDRAAHPRSLHAAYAIAAIALVVVAAAVSVWLYRRSENRHWAREQGLPGVARLAREQKPVAAYLLMRKVQQYLPGDPQVAQVAEGLTHPATVRSTPPGALVEVKDYLSPGDPWLALGTTPLNQVKLPTGYLRWRLTKAGMEESIAAPVPADMFGPLHEFNFVLDQAGAAPLGMVPVPAQTMDALVWSLGELGPFNLPKFYIDRFEVTNRQYQDFVGQGGYRKRQYWKEKFLHDGRELSWDQAMDLFHDSTGRPGPATWTAGHYPEGQADFPVGGVSWYEAAAYAEFAGKSLPVIAQWYLAAPSAVARYTVQLSNYSLSAPAPAGKYQGVGPWGTYDMGGNMSEWCWNQAGTFRYNLGGAWNTATSDYWEPGELEPFSRSPNNGFRCVRNTAALPAAAMAPVRLTIRDYAKVMAAPDDLFRVYRNMYAYDRTPLHPTVEPVDQDSPDWRKEKIVIDAAYGSERLPVYLFLPAKVRPPYQVVVFFPSARALGIPSSKTLGDMNFIDYVIQSGRAVLYPVYKGTYERATAGDLMPITATGRELVIEDSKDLGRSLDYLETRPEFDHNKIGYIGDSMGAALGVIFTAVDDRFKTAVFLDGGFFAEHLLPGTDQADFAPRLKKPVLMISGRYDWIFLGKDAMMRALGAPEADKKAILFDTAHDVSEQRADLIRHVLAWFDKYLGKVN